MNPSDPNSAYFAPDDTNDQPTQGSAGYSEKGAESISSITPEYLRIEREKNQGAEKAPSQETLRQSETPSQQDEPEPDGPLLKPTTPQQPKVNIVDKSHEKLTLHHLNETKDKLTFIADDKEEKFINEVEAHHEHQ